jgi:hypothetical protein
MRRTRAFGGSALLWLGLVVGACSTADGVSDQSASPEPPREQEPTGSTAAADTALIDVGPDSQASLALRGGIGPVIEGQTITKAMVTMEDVELVSASGAPVVLLHDPVTTDLLTVQDNLRPLFGDQAIEAGQFTQLRFRLKSAWIQTADDQGVPHVFASDQADRSQFSSIEEVNRLDLGGFDPDGFVDVALPQDGIQIQGTASLALSFSLAESLTVESDTVWALAPRVWIVDKEIFSSVDVEFDASSAGYEEFLSQGFRVMLLDADLRPVCETSVVEQSSTLFVAHFRFIEFFRGPFTAVLVPPIGFSLSSAVAVSIDVQQSVRVQASISVSSVQRISGTARAGTLEISTSSQASIVQRSSQGVVVRQGTGAVGSIEQVAPQTPPREPLRPGEQPPTRAPPPHLPGLPAPAPLPAVRDAGGQPPITDAGGPPPTRDAGGPPPVTDAGGPPPRRDAGGPPPSHDAGRPAFTDAGGPPPSRDAGGPPPSRDAGGPPPSRDAGGPRPAQGAGGPAGTQAGGQPPSRDAGRPPIHEVRAAPPPQQGGIRIAPPPLPTMPGRQSTIGTPAPDGGADAGSTR